MWRRWRSWPASRASARSRRSGPVFGVNAPIRKPGRSGLDHADDEGPVRLQGVDDDRDAPGALVSLDLLDEADTLDGSLIDVDDRTLDSGIGAQRIPGSEPIGDGQALDAAGNEGASNRFAGRRRTLDNEELHRAIVPTPGGIVKDRIASDVRSRRDRTVLHGGTRSTY